MVSSEDGSEQTKKRQRALLTASSNFKGHVGKSAGERTTTASWLDFVSRFRQGKAQRSKSPGRRAPPRSHSKSGGSIKSWHVKMPRQMVCTVMAVFLLIPLTIFWWKESHLHVHLRTKEHAETHAFQKRAHHNAFVTWMEDAEKEAASEHLLDKNVTQGNNTMLNGTEIFNQLVALEQVFNVGQAKGGEPSNDPSESNKNHTLFGNSDQGSNKDDVPAEMEGKFLSGEIPIDQGVHDTADAVDGLTKSGPDQAETHDSDQEENRNKVQDSGNNDRDEEMESEGNERIDDEEKEVDKGDEHDIHSLENNQENSGEEKSAHRMLRYMIKKTPGLDGDRRRLHHLVKPNPLIRSIKTQPFRSIQQWVLKFGR